MSIIDWLPDGFPAQQIDTDNTRLSVAVGCSGPVLAAGGMWHFFMNPHLPEMLFDGHELEFFTATFTAMSNPGTFSDHDLAAYARAYTGRERLRGGFERYRTLLDDGRETRALLARRKLPMPVLAVGSAQALASPRDQHPGGDRTDRALRRRGRPRLVHKDGDHIPRLTSARPGGSRAQHLLLVGKS
ncbi:hypothetical protein [Streptomyces sp. NPDC057302]|uniref:hypothetical protein n=1 Tax=Streptomyces sp. NPDC057302 TaxID=3346094 RepID=UPI00362B6AA6